ncbi:MFS transporter [Geminisphaera colitermitum]|uniref:MFS transporter n=1 Tax=Geminisphaera colitermitum TaxID=1148786 RepID=UPI000158D3A4|nr:MFS transporter [Geminisphaera colitermitum]
MNPSSVPKTSAPTHTPTASTPPTASVRPDDKIPLPQKLAFSFGASTDYIAAGMTIGVLWIPYFNIGMGISPGTLGVILMILQAWNAIIDPVMGNLSDNARTRWGRRRPFLVVGSVLTASLFMFLWRVPESLGETGKIIYLVVFGILFFTAFSSWAMPYYGMQLELTPSYDERTRLNAWTTFFGKVTSLVSGWVMAVITGPWFADPVTGKADIVRGMKTCSWFIAGGILMCGLLPGVFVKERYYAKETSRQARDPFWQSIRESAQCPPLWMLIGVTFFLVLGSSSVASLNQYLNIYYVMHGDLAGASVIAGWKASVLVVTGIVCIPLWTWLGEKFDKKTIVGSMLAVSIFGHLLNYWLLTPAHPYWQLISSVFESGAISAVWLFIPSMKADVADHDELHTTRRREGSLNAFYSWFFKASMTCAMGLSGFLLELCLFDVKLAEQSPETLQKMFWIYLILPLVLWGAAIVFIVRYPLTRQRMSEIRTALESRRGVL